MLDVSEAVKQAYINGNAKTEIFLTVTTTDGVVHEYNPRNILSGSVSIVESLCTSDNFDLSRVEKNQITFTLFNITENISDLQGASVVAKQRVYTDASDDTVYTDIPLGVYTVDTAELDGVYLYKCTCFDSTMLAFDAVIDDWWNTTVTFPITIKNLAIALFRYLNVPYSLPETFTNYDYQLTSRNAYFQQIKASELLGYMQEVVAGYFKADRQGVIHLKSAVLVPSGLYPHIGLYPREGLYPRPSNRAFGEEDTAGVGDWNYPQIVGDLTIADYTAKNVTKLQIRSSDNDIGIIVGNGTNTYVIQGNPLLYNLTDETGSPIAQAILDAVKHVNYRPFTGKFMAMPFVEVGDVAKVTTLNGRTFDSPIFQRTLSGAHLAFDNFVSPGYEYREQVKDTNRLLMTLNNTTHEIVNTVEELSSTITNVATNLNGKIENNTTRITQTEKDIASTVTSVTELDGRVDTAESKITQNATNIESAVSSVTALDGRVDTAESKITQNADNISLQAMYTGNYNLLVNSNFAELGDPTAYWTLENCTAEYVDDPLFGSGSVGKNAHGKALKITTEANKFCFLKQTININKVVDKDFWLMLSVRRDSADTPQFTTSIRIKDADGNSLGWYRGTYNVGESSVISVRQYFRKSFFENIEISTIEVFIQSLSTYTDPSIYYVNNCYATFSDTAPDWWTWTDIPKNNLISQINIAPEGIKIQGSKVDIYGLTTFHNSDGTGGTTIDGATLTAGTINGTAINGATITGSEIDSGDMYWYKGTTNEAKMTSEANINFGGAYYSGVMLSGSLVHINAKNGLLWLQNNNCGIWIHGTQIGISRTNGGGITVDDDGVRVSTENPSGLLKNWYLTWRQVKDTDGNVRWALCAR